MENMGDNIDRTADRCRQIVNEVDNFIVKNDTHKVFEATRQKYKWNYFLHLERLYKTGQLFIQRNKLGQIIGICGWILVDKVDEAFWFDIPNNKFIRRKNILKENLCRTAV